MNIRLHTTPDNASPTGLCQVLLVLAPPSAPKVALLAGKACQSTDLLAFDIVTIENSGPSWRVCASGVAAETQEKAVPFPE